MRFPLKTEAHIQTACRVLEELQSGYTNKDSPEKMGLQSLLMYLPTKKHPTGQRPALVIRGLYDGSEAECTAALGPLLAHMEDREKQVEIWERGHYLHLNEILLQTAYPPGNDMPMVSMNTKPLVDSRIIATHHPAEQWREVVDHFLAAPDKTIFIAMEHYGGQINDPDADHNAFFHRDASMDMFSWSFWTFEQHKRASVQWLDDWGRIAGNMGNGHRYQNYPRRGNVNFLKEYFGGNLERLIDVKRRYDPENLLAYEQSLTPNVGTLQKEKT